LEDVEGKKSIQKEEKVSPQLAHCPIAHPYPSFYPNVRKAHHLTRTSHGMYTYMMFHPSDFGCTCMHTLVGHFAQAPSQMRPKS
jgi:hypothetical protein